MALLTLKVEGMSCGGCAQTVEKVIGNLPGITNVKADHSTGSVKVEYFADAPGEETLSEALKKIGYNLSS